ncbi:MerR family transcriptional regulator [Bacillus horti]|uniref:DNA-binding transcriptional MerR regulator n=1 Tax=Caldalkalibacillus horti TaxID=77523 RepID=A0ABT9VW85_9BACI|nr:MerR family transcriptional regulator [Bacillus horti]MDQ0165263.1 DNA-binding transcriptional MerR regulator [Bacillus horti]
MKNELTIQEVAKRTGLTLHTLRYYERIGLMDPIKREANGHRSYNEDDLEWITILLHLRSTGMPISEMQRFANLVRDGHSTISERRELLEGHEQKLQLRLKEIKSTLKILDKKISHYRNLEQEEK